MLPDNLEAAFAAMQEMAKNIRVERGVGVILTLTDAQWDTFSEVKPQFRGFGPTIRFSDPQRKPPDHGSHYPALAWGKICEMLRTGKPSGRTEFPPKGENGYRGGVLAVKDGVATFIAYSGGTENEDVVIALEGLRALGLGENIVE